MTFIEPSPLEVRLTLLLGSTLARPFYQRFIRRLPLTGAENLMDFGSGSGVCSQHLARRLNRGGRLACVDLSTVWIEVCARTLRRFKNVSYHQGTLKQLALPEASFDGVLVHFVLHDIPSHERPEITAGLARLLKPGGALYLREPAENGGLEPQAARHLLETAGLYEIECWSEQHWYTGPVYAAIYRKAD